MPARNFLSLFFTCILIISCVDKPISKPKEVSTNQYEFDLQGHRGARGLLPENSLEAFKKAIDIGVNTLELDVVISKDAKVVVSHEAYMNPEICLKPDCSQIQNKDEFNLYTMDYEQIKQFDCGSKKHPRFPNQKNIKTYKPLLSEVLHLSSLNDSETISALNFNIELKSLPENDEVYHPEPMRFIELVIDEIERSKVSTRNIILQSFDRRIVDMITKKFPEYKIAYLVESGSIDDNLSKLERHAEIYSPLYTLLDSVQIKKAHKLGIKVIPWTVNNVSDMKNLLKMGVDGIITDYPDKAKPFHK